MRILVLLPIAGHPRFDNRIRGLRAAGADCRVLAFERPVQLERAADAAFESLGTIEHRRYLARVPRLLGAVQAVRAAARECDAVYCFGLDMLLLARAALLGVSPAPALAFEVGDVREVLMGDGPRARLARWIERRGLAAISLLVVTSEAYARGFYEPVQGLGDVPVRVLENKLDPGVLPEPPPAAPDDGVLRVLYSGWMCCARSWRALTHLAERGGDRVHVRLRGIFWADLKDVEPEVARHPNMEFGGPFRNPDELPALYDGVDLAWIAHHDLPANILWARATRFYTSGYFGVPMVAQRGTEDGREVEARGFGPVIDLADPEAAAEQILATTPDALARWRQALANTPRERFVYSDEHAELLADLGGARSGDVA